MRPARVLAFAVLAVLALGLAAGLGLGRPAGPVFAGLPPAVTLSAIVVAGFADGFNPCAFTVLLLFVAALMAAAQLRAGEGAAAVRGRVLGLGSIYVAAVFLTYLALGVGLLAASAVFTQAHVPARVGAVLSIALGLWMLKDYFVPGLGGRLRAPAAVGGWARASARRMTVPGLVAGGIFIGLCTVPCSGAVYLSVLSLLAAQADRLAGFGYLLLYNVMFTLPLAALLVAASSRPVLAHLARWNLAHRERVSLALGTGVVLLGFAILVTV